MKELNFRDCILKYLFYSTFLCLISILILSCKEDSTPVNTPTTPTAGPAGIPLHVLGPANGQPTILSGSVNSSNANDFRIFATVLSAAGGSPLSGYTWTISNLSSFPSGTTVEPLTGIFKWNGANNTVPPGSYPFSMTISDGANTATGNYVFVLTSYTIPPSAIFQQPGGMTFRLDTAISGKAYGSSLFVTAGSSGPNSNNLSLPLTWNLATGTLPAGLVIDRHSGVVRGTPMTSAAGQDYTFTISVTNQSNQIADCPGGCIVYKLFVK